MRNLFLLLACVVVFVITAIADITWAGPKTIKVASLEWPPYSSAEMSNKGTAIQTLETILYKANINLTVDFLPWERSLMLIKTGSYDGIFPCWPEEVPEGFDASVPITTSSVSMVVRDGSTITFTDMEDLFKTKKIALVRGYKYSSEIMSLAEKYRENIVTPPNDLSMFRMLMAGRFDIALTDFSVLEYYAAREKLTPPVEIKKLYEKPLVFAAKKDSGLVNIINNRITGGGR